MLIVESLKCNDMMLLKWGLPFSSCAMNIAMNGNTQQRVAFFVHYM